MELDVVYNEDCLEGMKRIPDKSIDMILCDLPYGTTQCKWDNKIPLNLLWEQYKRIIKQNGAIVLFAQIPFSIELASSNIKWLRYEWIWDKRISTGFLNANKMPLKAHENILVFYKHLPKYHPQFEQTEKPYTRTNWKVPTEIYQKVTPLTGIIRTYNKKFPTDIKYFKAVPPKDRLHQTEKPTELLEYLIKTYSDEGDIVLDNACGSGSTLVAAQNTNRHYIGFEIDDKFYKIAKARLENEARKKSNGQAKKDVDRSKT